MDAQAQGVPEDSTVESIRVNCNGTKVSVLFSLPGSATTHTVLAVYDVDSDALRTFDFAQTGRVPESHSWDNSVPMMFGVQTVAVGWCTSTPVRTMSLKGGTISKKFKKKGARSKLLKRFQMCLAISNFQLAPLHRGGQV